MLMRETRFFLLQIKSEKISLFQQNFKNRTVRFKTRASVVQTKELWEYVMCGIKLVKRHDKRK